MLRHQYVSALLEPGAQNPDVAFQNRMCLSLLIKQLTGMEEQKHPACRLIKRPLLLMHSLRELDSMIELDQIKEAVASQVKLHLLGPVHKNKNPSLLHTVLAGSPGTGKTTVGHLLAKIWTALGLIQAPSQKFSSLEAELSHLQQEKRQLARLRESLREQELLLRETRRYLLQLNPQRSQRSTRRSNPTAVWHKTLGCFRTLTHNLQELQEEELLKDEAPATFVIATREDLVAEYLGQTAPKTKKVLERARGGVLFIDEAYSLCISENGTKDKYGEEALTVINEYMSLYPDELIVIFAGYLEKLQQTIFRVQPGLYRRCGHFFEMPDYSVEGWCAIFARQLRLQGWTLDTAVSLMTFVPRSIEQQRARGLDRLLLLVKLEYAEERFGQLMDQSSKANHDQIITATVLERAVKRWCEKSTERDEPPAYLYS